MSFNLNLDKSKTIHLLGIGGVSMSAIASLLAQKGYAVTGSDDFDSQRVQSLRAKGIHVNIGLKAENIKENSIVVYSYAIQEDNPEFRRAVELNLEIYSRAKFLGLIMKSYKHSIGVSGTHGKTTTTSMLSHILMEGNTDPTLFVGGNLDLINGNLRIGDGECFLTEACEYRASFLSFIPSIGIVLNIDEDHLDFYRDINHIEETFSEYAHSISSNGYIAVNSDDDRCMNITKNCKCNVFTFGKTSGDLRAMNISYRENGEISYDLYYKDSLLGKIDLASPGDHDIYNSLGAIAAGLILDIDFEKIKSGIESFKGTHRRFERMGTHNSAQVIADYAHQPNAIITALNSAKRLTKKKLYCVFQPHTYTRTHALLKEFASCFTSADEVIITDIYAAREKDTGVVNSEILVEKTKEYHKDVKYMDSMDKTAEYLHSKLSKDDLLMIVGAGDIINLWDKLENF